jgi:hypothetical protein
MAWRTALRSAHHAQQFAGIGQQIQPAVGSLANITNALKHFGAEHYVKARETGHVFYVEGSTDVDMLRAFADKLEHPVMAALLCGTGLRLMECVRRRVVGLVVGVPGARAVARPVVAVTRQAARGRARRRARVHALFRV